MSLQMKNNSPETEDFLALATLISRDRLDEMRMCVEMMAANTHIPSHMNGRRILWYIFSNGSSDRVCEYLRKLVELQPYPQFLFEICLNSTNLGCGAGLNRLWHRTKSYKYTLQTEEDWLLLNEKCNGVGSKWLESFLEVFEREPDLTAVYLRQYTESACNRRHYANFDGKNAGPKQTYKDLVYYHQPMYKYGNGVRIQRNADFARFLPQPEFLSPTGEALEIKGKPEWGRSEIQMENVLVKNRMKVYFSFLFAHYDDIIGHWRQVQDATARGDVIGCGLYRHNQSVLSCKYRFTRVTGEPAHCMLCDHTKDIQDASDHDARYVEWLRVKGQAPTTDIEDWAEKRMGCKVVYNPMKKK